MEPAVLDEHGSRALACQLAAGDNILVNTVCIGLIKSGQHERRYAREAGPGANIDLDSLYAEDAQRGFLPCTGRITQFEVPATVRVDAGVAAGCKRSTPRLAAFSQSSMSSG